MRVELKIDVIADFLSHYAKHSDSVYWLSSPDFKKIYYISPAYNKIWGRDVGLLYNNPKLWIKYLVGGESQSYDPIANMAYKIQAEGELAKFNETYQIMRPDGEMRWILDRGFPIYNEDTCCGVTGVAMDITEHKLVEENLKAANEKIEQLNKTLKIYAASQAHELRTPLAIIAMQVHGMGDFVKDLLVGYTLAKQAGLKVPTINSTALELLPKIINNVEAEVRRSNAIINTTLSQIDLYDKNIPMDDECSMQACVAKALSRHPFKDMAERALVHFEQEVDFTFLGSQTLMVHIIFNLLKNALHYIAKKHKGEITIALASHADSNVLTFTDTAEGIKVDKLEKVFEEFYSERERGTGVGLAFCKDVVQKFGGTMHCESVYGDYVRFIISLPKLPGA